MVNVYFAVQLARIYATLGYLLGNCCDPSSPVPPPVRAFFLGLFVTSHFHWSAFSTFALVDFNIRKGMCKLTLSRAHRPLPGNFFHKETSLGRGHDITLRKIRTGNIALKFTGRICAYSKGPRRLCARGKYFPPDWWKSPSFRVCAQFSSCAN